MTRQQMVGPVFENVKNSVDYERYLERAVETAIDGLKKTCSALPEHIRQQYKPPQTGEDYFNILKDQRGGMIRAPHRRPKSQAR